MALRIQTLQQGFDLFDDSVEIRKLAGFLFGINLFTIDADFENAAA